MRHSIGIACATLCAVLAAGAPAHAVPSPIHAWTFDDGTARDVVGGLNGTLSGDAAVSNGKLVLDGNANGSVTYMGDNRTYMGTAADTVSLTAMTLVSWVSLGTLSQGGGSALSVVDGNQQFDAIDYNEPGGQQWINGSDYFNRTNTGNRAAVADLNEHMMATTFAANGSITLYMDGAFYANGGTYNPLTLVDPHYLIGLRHDAAGGNGLLTGSVDLASVYGTALSAADIATLYAQGPATAVPEPASLALLGLGAAGIVAVRRRRAG